MHREKFKFIGRYGDRYVWERKLPNTVQVLQITCSVRWFWASPERRREIEGRR